MLVDMNINNHSIKNSSINPDNSSGRTVLFKQLQSVAETVSQIHHIVTQTAKSPARIVNALATTTFGLQSMYAGSIASGAALTVTGLKELHNVYAGPGMDQSRLLQLMGDLKGAAGALSSMQEENKLSLERIDTRINEVTVGVAGMKAVMTNINDISGKNANFLNKEITNAAKLSQEAHDLFTKGLEKLKAAKESHFAGEQQLIKTDFSLRKLESYQKLGSKPTLEATMKLDGLSKEIAAQNIAIQKCFTNADAEREEGFRIIAEAYKKQEAATAASIEGMRIAESTLNEISKKSKIDAKDLEINIESLKKEVGKVQVRVNAQSDLLGDMSKMIDEATEIAEQSWGTKSMVVAVASTAAATSLSGPTIGTGVGIFIANAYHSRNYIAKKIYEFFFGKIDYAPQKNISDHISYAFDGRSSGWSKYFSSEPSRTTGLIQIRVGAETLKYRFNLNNKNFISLSDINELTTKMREAIDKKQMGPEVCQKIMEQLENTIIDRGAGHKMEIGFLKKQCTEIGETFKPSPFFASLRIHCKDLLERSNNNFASLFSQQQSKY